MTPAAQGPSHASSSAVSSLPPAFPRRAPWGTAGSLRAWQAAALEQYMAASPKDFLAVATPGAGKTTFALRIAVELMGAGVVEKVTIVCPTEHLKSQWAEAAGRVGIHIDPAFSNSQGMAGSHFDGVAVTYAQVASNPMVHAARTRLHRTLVILDEIHHAGDSLSWGDGVRDAFDEATRRLALTGTPFRSDTSAIPFVRYEEDEEGIKRSKADFTYGYGDALRDFVVRPVLFMSYSGQMSWRTNAGDIYTARLGEPLTKDLMKQAWRTALDPKGEWMSAVLQAADQRLEEVRRQVPDAGGLVIAADQEKARAYARQLRAITGHRPTVVLSDDADASPPERGSVRNQCRDLLVLCAGSWAFCARKAPRRNCDGFHSFGSSSTQFGWGNGSSTRSRVESSPLERGRHVEPRRRHGCAGEQDRERLE